MHARNTTHDDRLGSQEWLDFSLTKTAQMLSEKWPDANIYVVRYGPVVAHDVTRLCGRPLVGGTPTHTPHLTSPFGGWRGARRPSRTDGPYSEYDDLLIPGNGVLHLQALLADVFKQSACRAVALWAWGTDVWSVR
jgi:hypothetical protein